MQNIINNTCEIGGRKQVDKHTARIIAKRMAVLFAAISLVSADENLPETRDSIEAKKNYLEERKIENHHSHAYRPSQDVPFGLSPSLSESRKGEREAECLRARETGRRSPDIQYTDAKVFIFSATGECLHTTIGSDRMSECSTHFSFIFRLS